jgi:hypothetical protein
VYEKTSKALGKAHETEIFLFDSSRGLHSDVIGGMKERTKFKSGGKHKTAALVVVVFFSFLSSSLHRTLVLFFAIAVRSFHIPK